MAFLDDLVDKAQKAGKFVIEKADDTKDYVTLEYRSLSVKNKIDEQYKALGKLIYTLSDTEAEDDGKTQEYVDVIRDLTSELNAINEEISKFKNICKNCGTTNRNRAEFCEKCGKPLK